MEKVFSPRAILLVLLLLGGAWAARRRWTRHDVSDPGVTL